MAIINAGDEISSFATSNSLSITNNSRVILDHLGKIFMDMGAKAGDLRIKLATSESLRYQAFDKLNHEWTWTLDNVKKGKKIAEYPRFLRSAIPDLTPIITPATAALSRIYRVATFANSAYSMHDDEFVFLWIAIDPIEKITNSKSSTANYLGKKSIYYNSKQ